MAFETLEERLVSAQAKIKGLEATLKKEGQKQAAGSPREGQVASPSTQQQHPALPISRPKEVSPVPREGLPRRISLESNGCNEVAIDQVSDEEQVARRVSWDEGTVFHSFSGKRLDDC